MVFLFFDIDGTLIHSGGAGARALERAFYSLYGIKNAMEGITPHGKTDPVIVEEIFLKKLGISPQQNHIQQVLDLYLQFLEEEVQSSPGYKVIDGVKETLSEISKSGNLLQGLATGNIEKGAYIKLKRGGLHHFFRFGGFGSDSKDRTEILKVAYKRGIELAGIKPHRVFVIGDTPLDIIAAKEAGFGSIAVATSIYDIHTLRSYSPDKAFNNIIELREFLKNLRN